MLSQSANIQIRTEQNLNTITSSNPIGITSGVYWGGNKRIENVILITIAFLHLCKQTKMCGFGSHYLCFTCAAPIINVGNVLLSIVADRNH